MKMFQVVDTSERQLPPSLANYFRTSEEAVAYIDGASMHDREGDHAGHEYLVIKIVERDSHPCTLCAREVTAKDPEKYPYCRNCYYTGAVADYENAEPLHYFSRMLPDFEVGVEHTGGGCFWLAFREGDDPLYYIATDGEASLPDDWNTGWGYVGRQYYDPNDDEGSEAHPDYNGHQLFCEYSGDAGPGESGRYVEIPKEKVVELILADRRLRAFERLTPAEVDELNAAAARE